MAKLKMGTLVESDPAFRMDSIWGQSLVFYPNNWSIIENVNLHTRPSIIKAAGRVREAICSLHYH